METPATFKQHPYVWGGGTAALVLLYLYSRRSTASPSNSGTAVVSSTIDPTQAALTAQQMQDNVAMATANLQAQTTVASLNAAQTINGQNVAGAVHIAGVNANVTNAQTAASIFGQAVSGLTENNAMAIGQQSAVSGDYTTGIAPGTAIVPGGPGWQSWMAPFAHSTDPVPIVTGGGQSTLTNVTNNQIEELFNNVINAGQGNAPLQTVTMQPSGGGQQITGYGTIDPVFATWSGSGQANPNITDVTVGPQGTTATNLTVSQPGQTASTPVPAATVANLPQYGGFPGFQFP